MVNQSYWLAHYPEDIPATIAYEEKSLDSFLVATANQFPKKKALHFMGKDIAFRDVYSQAKRLAAYFQSLGLKKGDRVAIMLPNTPQAVISYYGALLAGAIVVQTNPLYKERELEHQLVDSGATFIVCLDVLLPRVSQVRGRTDLKHIIVTKIKDYLPFPKSLFYPFIQKKENNMIVKAESAEDIHIWQSIMKHSDEHDYTPVTIDPKEDVALLQYTGGTTGRPKGCMLTHYNLVSNVQMCRNWLYKAEAGNETVLGVLPFFHVYGMTTIMNLSVMYGFKMILMPKFKAEDVLKTIQKQKPTLFPGAPTIYIGLLSHPNLKKYDLSSIKACISGSAPLPVEVQEQFEKVTNGQVVEGYGLTESSPVTHANFIWGKRVSGSIGVPWPDTDATIVLENGDNAATGEVGELAIKGPQVMKGYWRNEDETNQVLNNGWLFTGDMGYMDEEGYFYIVDRKKDVIIAGGFNIYPREVEEMLYEHEAIQEAAIVGVPDAYRGETVKAFIVPKDGHHVDEKMLDTFCRNSLAAFKVPRIYEFRHELPKSAVGKILRHQLKDEDAKQQSKLESV